MSTARRFTTTIARSGSRTYLVLPFDLSETWGAKQRHMVARKRSAMAASRITLPALKPTIVDFQHLIYG